jgi:D-alanyl-D-alanine dipeptidase
MPTKMHELSEAAATFTGPVSGSSRTAWKSATLSASMNAPAKRLQKYMTNAGLTPLASEWWHFNDLDALELTSADKSTGKYVLSGVVSEAP